MHSFSRFSDYLYLSRRIASTSIVSAGNLSASRNPAKSPPQQANMVPNFEVAILVGTVVVN
jgi:hypothetical protein